MPSGPDRGLLPALEDRLRAIASASSMGAVAVAFSGGLDSRFLLHTAKRAGVNARALHVNGPHIPSREHAFAVHWAKNAGIPLTVVHLNPLDDSLLRNNPEDRCYHCKKAVFAAIRDAAGGLPLLDGSNVSDDGEYRPGKKALKELGVLSPLAETGYAKDDIRHAARITGMDDPAQVAQPCLLTRFGYGAALTAEALHAVDKAENAVRDAFAARGMAAVPFRLRYENAGLPALHHSGTSLSGELREAVAFALAGTGFPGIPLRRMERLSGFFDRLAGH